MFVVSQKSKCAYPIRISERLDITLVTFIDLYTYVGRNIILVANNNHSNHKFLVADVRVICNRNLLPKTISLFTVVVWTTALLSRITFRRSSVLNFKSVNQLSRFVNYYRVHVKIGTTSSTI